MSATLAPVALLRLRPETLTARHGATIVLLVWPEIWHALLGAELTSEFPAFGLLALLAFNRDWRIVIVGFTTTLMFQLAAHDAHGERDLWMMLEVVALIVSAIQADAEMEDAANREAALEQSAKMVQRKVDLRTRALRERTERYRSLVENTEAVPFEYDYARRQLRYVAPRAAEVFGTSIAELHQAGMMVELTHPEDLETVRHAIRAFVSGARAANEPLDYRLVTPSGVRHVRTFFSDHSGTALRGVTLDITRQVSLEHDLRQAHKLESVGRLAAGIAHEINTPVQFVNDSVEFIRVASSDLIGVIHAQARALADCAPSQSTRGAASVAEAADLEFIETELPQAISRALDGSQRIAEIVRSMRRFAHPDRGPVSECDLRAEIASTLTIARAEYRYVADLVTHYDDVGLVQCSPGEMNQVVLNLVVNAAHAIADKVRDTSERGVIEVRLAREDDDVVISVRDTGGGIHDQVRDHIFDQFFTTKPVGQGTGQGLSLALGVVRRHHGTLTFETQVGVGTVFFVRIPMRRGEPERSAA